MKTYQRQQLNELLKRQKRVTELQIQLATSDQELTMMREQMNEYQGQGELLMEERQLFTELQSQLDTNQQETTTMREQMNESQELLRDERQRVTELLSQLETNRQEMTTIREQLSETQQLAIEHNGAGQINNPRDWVIRRHDILKTSELGRGAWGKFYPGKFHGCDVAVKQMHKKILSDYNRRLFEQEVEIASKCRHPCLLQFIGATSDGDRPLLVTKIMDCSLRTGLYNEDEPYLSFQQKFALFL